MPDDDGRAGRPSLRTSLARVLDAAGAVDAAFRVRRRMRLPLLPILTYHRIGAASGEDEFDAEVVDATPEAFERQVRILSESFCLIGTEELRDFVRGEADLPPNPAMITFDDGYRECRDVVLPILLRYRARATFFVTTSFVADRRIPWWDAVAWIVKRARRHEIVVDYPEATAHPIDPGGVAAAIARLLRVVKDFRGIDVPRYVDAVARGADVPWNRSIERELADSLVLTWEQVRDLSHAGMDVQSHTRTHRILQTVTDEDLDGELAGARADLEAALDRSIDAVAYPVGGSIEMDPRLCAAVRRAGYRLGFSNATGTNLLAGRLDPFDIRRIAAPGDLPEPYFRAVLAFPSLAHPRRVHRPRAVR